MELSETRSHSIPLKGRFFGQNWHARPPIPTSRGRPLPRWTLTWTVSFIRIYEDGWALIMAETSAKCCGLLYHIKYIHINKKVRLRERPKVVLLSNWGTSLYLFLINSHFWEIGKRLAQYTFTTMEVNAKIGPWGYFFFCLPFYVHTFGLFVKAHDRTHSIITNY